MEEGDEGELRRGRAGEELGELRIEVGEKRREEEEEKGDATGRERERKREEEKKREGEKEKYKRWEDIFAKTEKEERVVGKRQG